jgi:hypothetical protein
MASPFTHYKNLCMVRARQLACAAQLVRERNNQGRRNDVKARGGGQIFVKGHFWIYVTKRCLQNIGSWTSPNHVFYLLDDRGCEGVSPPGDCAILEARWLHFLRFLKISDNSLFRQGNPLNWKGTFAPLAPPGKGQRGSCPSCPPPQFRRPWEHRNRRAAGSIPARRPIVAAVPGQV